MIRLIGELLEYAKEEVPLYWIVILIVAVLSLCLICGKNKTGVKL